MNQLANQTDKFKDGEEHEPLHIAQSVHAANQQNGKGLRKDHNYGELGYENKAPGSPALKQDGGKNLHRKNSINLGSPK